MLNWETTIFAENKPYFKNVTNQVNNIAVLDTTHHTSHNLGYFINIQINIWTPVSKKNMYVHVK
jgi:hypothetical protein